MSYTEALSALKRLAEKCEINEVFQLAASANENAAATVGNDDSDEFYDMWLATVQGLLTSRETSDEARTWFAARGVRG